MSEDGNSSKMTIDENNVTLPSGEKKKTSSDDVNSSNNEVNSVDRRTASQMHQSQSEEEKASLRTLSTKFLKTILRELRQDRVAAEKKYKGLTEDKAVILMTEELRIRGVPEYLIPIP